MLEYLDIILPTLRTIVVVFTGLILGLLITVFDRRARGISDYRKIRTSFSLLVADYIKMIFKERVSLPNAKAIGLAIVPVFALVLSLLPLAAVPLFYDVVVAGESYPVEVFSSDYGLIFCILCLTVFSYFISVSGFIFRSSHSSLKSYRMLAHLLLDDILIIVSLIGIVLSFKTLSVHEIIQEQGSYILNYIPAWGIVIQPVGGLIFLLAIISKCERIPFNYSSSVNEVGAGIEVDFGGSGFLIMALSKKFFIVSCVMIFVAFFMGGYNLLPGLEYVASISPRIIYFLQAFSFIVKAIIILMVVASITGPRLQYDKSVLMNWIILFPIAMVNLIATVLVTHYFGNSWI